MSAFGSAWGHRIAVAVDNTGGTAGAFDVSITLSAAHSDFWDHVLNTGYDVRFATADGATGLTFKRTTWNYASKSAVFELDAVTLAVGTHVVWMYWGNAAAADGATSPTITAPKAGTIYLGRPAGNVVRMAAEPYAATEPFGKLNKATAEATRVWWDFRHLLERAGEPINGANLYEEPKAVTLTQVIDAADGPQASMVDATLTVVTGHMVGMWLKGGATLNTYMVICRVQTSLDRILEGRALLTVNDLEV